MTDSPTSNAAQSAAPAEPAGGFPELPQGFLFGVASASYQVEGAVDEDGRGRSVWDTFCDRPGAIANGDTGAVACDHYHRYREDVALLKDLGVDSYRFSIAWPRVLPAGTGEVNAAGLDFYDRLVDELLAAGIQPAATLFHWDTPQALEDVGGWASRDTAEHFAAYASVVGERLGDRVARWMTLNEPNVVTMLGYALGVHAPGRSMGFEALPVAHHLLLGHGLAAQALRAAGCSNLGIASNHAPVWPASDSPEDRQAAEVYDNLWNWMFADPVLLGRYPVEGTEQGFPTYRDGDLETIRQPLDWFGINYYNPARIGAPGSAPAGDAATGQAPAAGEVVADGPPMPEGLPFESRRIEGYERTDFDWPIVPEGLAQVVRQFRDRYGDALPPVYITESGCSFSDGPVDGRVADDRRIAYHDAHLRALAGEIAGGADVRGYFAWSATDNFEWAEGYRQRFGLVHVDYDTQVRTPKDSYHWYRDLIAHTRDR
ncbi:beta-glucosidase [Phycicoccus sp. M110.8]|uniref:glycoside hydrolase family 1 protein n=1 Tax=Phycicoccus sp. M110.8 TaxID=3075433 RepID=UPI0028FD3F90|nr:beta-glucosidase [Phycicoccus sp. M110.8]MDU0315118.1 beta-glucosidase [Phycicoccus sp. M110.8]